MKRQQAAYSIAGVDEEASLVDRSIFSKCPSNLEVL